MPGVSRNEFSTGGSLGGWFSASVEMNLGDSRRRSEERPFLSARTVKKEGFDLITVRRRLSFGIFPRTTKSKGEALQALEYGESEGTAAQQKARGYSGMLVVVLGIEQFQRAPYFF